MFSGEKLPVSRTGRLCVWSVRGRVIHPSRSRNEGRLNVRSYWLRNVTWRQKARRRGRHPEGEERGHAWRRALSSRQRLVTRSPRRRPRAFFFRRERRPHPHVAEGRRNRPRAEAVHVPHHCLLVLTRREDDLRKAVVFGVLFVEGHTVDRQREAGDSEEVEQRGHRSVVSVASIRSAKMTLFG